MALILSFKSPSGTIYYGKGGMVSTKRAAKRFTGAKDKLKARIPKLGLSSQWKVEEV